MVQPGKKAPDTSNGTYKNTQSNMSFQAKNFGGAGKSGQNGKGFTDTAISSGNRVQGERTLQRWVPDVPADTTGSLESASRMKPSGGAGWDQFAENERLFGMKTDYDENIYTTTIDKSHPQYKQRLADAERKAREIERSVPNNAHVAEERIVDNLGPEENGGLDEEDKYSGVRRKQDFPPLTSSSNKYTPPARRAPTGQSTVKGAPVDPAIISSQLVRPDKPVTEKAKAADVPKSSKPEIAIPPTTTDSSHSATPEPKVPATNTPSSSSRTASPQVKVDGVPNATATVERDVASAFKNFAAHQRKTVESARTARARNDKEIKLNDLKKFADSFKLKTPVPSDLVPIIAKDPAKQKEIQEKAKRNAEENKANPSEGVMPIPPPVEVRSSQRPGATTHGTSPANIPSRQNTTRNTGYSHQSQFRGTSQAPQVSPSQQSRPPPGGLGGRLRSAEQNKVGQLPPNPTPAHEARQPPTGPANGDPNLSRRSSGVTSTQGARLNPTIGEFRPSIHAPSFNPNGNPSSVSSPRSVVNAVPQAPIARSLLRRKPIPESERPALKEKFNCLDHIMTIKPGPEKNWKQTGGLKPAYETPVLWKTVNVAEDKPESNIHMTYTKMFELAPFPAHTMSPAAPPHATPQVPHQHQLPFHLQQSGHAGARQSPRQAPVSMHGSHHPHGPAQSFNGHEDHRMMQSQSAQSFASPRLQNVPMQYNSPMNQPAQMYGNPQMMGFPGGGPPIPYQQRSLSQSQGFVPPGGPMGPIMMQNPNGAFMASQGMAPGPPMIFNHGQGFMPPPNNGMPPQMPGVNGYPSPGRGPPMMMQQGSQQGHQQPQAWGMNPGMSPSPQYNHAAPMYNNQQPPGQMGQMRGGYGGPGQFGTSPNQQMHQLPPQQHRNNGHPNGNYNNQKNFQQQGSHHQNGPANNQVPTGPQARASEGNDESK
ncbi:LsmAD domain-containing protein [Drepanopeziza brunnea f. sp. 'multigermtubi' MB_m1]|uniref:LsmAD domain-containing protein n=1 Tax=Marssonina brunnea f. sp. multigermtubi (strain MB_m1) TaxID=1072389 RepID=K1WHA8_MARBU|nr:LsmAD domain-containing protein [Drepanopeziza brunnea f. sp. 'multigermtubi' MB_m1]EKD16985.1 LsmAD domain-containing protein [Drepanopeziza brunnea f. sp. 'multigermtubi' MB_m1]